MCECVCVCGRISAHGCLQAAQCNCSIALTRIPRPRAAKPSLMLILPPKGLMNHPRNAELLGSNLEDTNSVSTVIRLRKR